MKSLSIISTVLTVLLMFTGCSRSFTTLAKEDFRPGKVEWGMTIKEACKALNIREQDIIKRSADVDSLRGVETWSTEKLQIDNTYCKINLSFSDGSKKLISKGKLVSIDVFYKDKDLLENRITEFSKQFGEGVPRSSEKYGKMFNWDSELSLAECIVDKKISVEEYYKAKYSTTELDEKLSEDDIFKALDKMPVAELSVGLRGQPDEDGYYGFWSVNGIFAASVACQFG